MKSYNFSSTHRDRLSRVGAELFDWIFKKYNTKLVVLYEKPDRSYQEELADDLITISTVYTARYYGKRGSEVRKKNKILSEQPTEEKTE